MNLSTRERALFVLATLVTAGFLIYVFLFMPAFGQWKRQDTLIRERKNRIAALERELKREPEITEQYNAALQLMREDRARQSAPLFSQLQDTAAAAGALVENIDPVPDRRHTYFTESAVALELRSDLPSLVRFLYELTAGDARMDVRSIRVRPDRDDASQLITNLRVAVRTFNSGGKQP